MAPDNELGSCRHCDHWPVHASARWCPACGGIAPFTRTPPKKNRNLLVAGIITAVLAVAGGVAVWLGGGF